MPSSKVTLKIDNNVLKFAISASNFNMMKYGVPQGTVLGAILFILYLNNILQAVFKGHIDSFADDTAVIYKSQRWKQLKLDVEKDFAHIMKWFNSRLLRINTQ